MKAVAAIRDPLILTGETLTLLAWHIPDLVAYQHQPDEWWLAPLDDDLPLIRLNQTGLDLLKAMNGHRRQASSHRGTRTLRRSGRLSGRLACAFDLTTQVGY